MLDGLIGLQRANDARQNSNDASLGAGGNESRRRRLGEEATITRRSAGVYGHCLAEELQNATVGKGLPRKHTGVVDQEFGGEVVGAVYDEVVGGDNFGDILGSDPGLVGDHLDVGV